MVFLLVFFTWVHHHPLRSDQYFCLVPTTYESTFLEHLNKLVVEPIDDILIFSMFEDIHIGNLALILETCENHLCVIMKYVFWMLKVTFSPWFTCNCWKMSPWIQEEFTLFPRESSRIGHACANYSWDGRLLPPSSKKKFYMHTRQLTDLFKNEKKFKTFTIFFHVLPLRTRLCFIAISSCWCNCLWAVTILLIFSELYIVAISWESSNATR
jgi:hypothetical protein